MSIIYWAIFGAIVGGIARALLPSKLPTGWLPTIAVGVPRRAEAIAWLRPLPPGRNETSAPRIVSPGAGRRSLPAGEIGRAHV
jgi:hypothetical protein